MHSATDVHFYVTNISKLLRKKCLLSVAKNELICILLSCTQVEANYQRVSILNNLFLHIMISYSVPPYNRNSMLYIWVTCETCYFLIHNFVHIEVNTISLQFSVNFRKICMHGLF